MRSWIPILTVAALLGACPPASEPSRPAAPSAGAGSAIPPGSGDYSALLAITTDYQQGRLNFEELKTQVLARRLPPHPLGCAYLMMPVPAPPPGVAFDPAMMPKDWEGTWGEVAMTFWLGRITREEYERLHAAAHPDCPK